MKQILLIEDEPPAAHRLQHLLNAHRPGWVVLAVIDSVEKAVLWLQENPAPDLVFLDIQLADGLSFEIFAQTPITAPIIFTTAYDEYTLEAFRVNSIDYLLKPIENEELLRALNKFDHFFDQPRLPDAALMQTLLRQLTEPSYKERFLVRTGQTLMYLNANTIRFFFTDSGLTFARTEDNRKCHIEQSLEQLEQVLHPRHFFRINRQVIIHLEAIQKIHAYFNGRLKLELMPNPDFEVILSRERVPDFRRWLDS
ncbi:MAG: response regulator transcription factor [Lewinellaceae bacterium]|nr:response regulator transcription factor [Lewinellaceae bacterium]